MRLAAVALAVVALGAYLVTRPAQASNEPGWADETGVTDQLPTEIETLRVYMDPSTYNTGALPGDLADANQRAFLDMLAISEATAGRGDNGYNVLFGGGLFTSYADHPRQLITRTFSNGVTVTSSAAGRYQFIRRTWDGLGGGEFTPAAQDAAALKLIAQHGALSDVRAGRFEDAIAKLNSTWASLPGSPYGQPTHSLETLAGAFTNAGGTIA